MTGAQAGTEGGSLRNGCKVQFEARTQTQSFQLAARLHVDVVLVNSTWKVSAGDLKSV